MAEIGVVIVAGGSGKRMGAALPKQFMMLGNLPILGRTINSIREALPASQIVVVLPEDHIELWKNIAARFEIAKHSIAAGGKERFHSVKSGIDALSPEIKTIAIHDGVRPLVSVELVREMFRKAVEIPALIPVLPCIDTMKVLKNEDGRLCAVEGAVADRSVLYAAQTPQIFHSEVLKSAYSLPYDTSFTDDASVVQKYGKSLSYIMGERLNIKITTQEDLLLAKAVMSLRDND